MHRWTARVLLTLLLVGVLAPAGLALSAPPEHACCHRKMMHDYDPHQARFQTSSCCQQNGCRSLTRAQWAETGPAASGWMRPAVSVVPVAIAASFLHTDLPASHLGRAPPVSFIS